MKYFVPLAILFCTLREKSHLVGAGAPAECPELNRPPFTVNIPHETEYDKFYICQKDNKIEMVCPGYLEFNADTQICDWPVEANYELQYEEKSECKDDQLLPHETNCNRYYRCVYGTKVLKLCPRNMLFNKELGNCDFNYNVQCIEDEVRPQEVDIKYSDGYYLDQEFDSSSAGSFSEGVEYLTTHKNLKFPVDCPEVTDYEPVLLPHDKICNAYYKCSKGKKQLMRCPGMLQFNPGVLLCDLPGNVRCIERKVKISPTRPRLVCPQTDCQNSTTYLPTTEDPRRFIRCENGKEVHEECPNGLVFDVKLNVCNLAHLATTSTHLSL